MNSLCKGLRLGWAPQVDLGMTRTWWGKKFMEFCESLITLLGKPVKGKLHSKVILLSATEQERWFRWSRNTSVRSGFLTPPIAFTARGRVRNAEGESVFHGFELYPFKQDFSTFQPS
jgi:hypothetical protein